MQAVFDRPEPNFYLRGLEYKRRNRLGTLGQISRDMRQGIDFGQQCLPRCDSRTLWPHACMVCVREPTSLGSRAPTGGGRFVVLKMRVTTKPALQG